jgi:ketosteroid isomerase-like protein
MARYAEGMTTEEVCESLSLSNKTVSTYTTRAREKMSPFGDAITMIHACVLVDRHMRSGSEIPQNFAILIQQRDGKLTSQVVLK